MDKTVYSAENARLLHYEDCGSAIDELFRAALSHEPDRAFEGFLGFAERFSGLSIYNAMLLRIQRPGAVAVASAAKWASIERSVKPGATPLVLLQTFGPVRFVYEYSDTEGREISGAQANCLFAEGGAPPRRYEQLVAAAAGNRVRITHTDRGLLSAGFATIGHKVEATWHASSKDMPHCWDVVVNSKLDSAAQFATLAHELGHVYCGHLGGHPMGAWPARQQSNVAARELEAESVAWLVCNRNGVEPRSVAYLADYARSANLIDVSMFAIYDAANRVESRSAARRAKNAGSIKTSLPARPTKQAPPGADLFPSREQERTATFH